MEENIAHEVLYGYFEIGRYLGGLGYTHTKRLARDAGLPVFHIRRRPCALKSRLDAWRREQDDKAALLAISPDEGVAGAAAHTHACEDRP